MGSSSAGHVDALAIGQLAADHHAGIGEVRAAAFDDQPQLAIVEQQFGARRQGREDFRVRQADAARVTRRIAEFEPERLRFGQRDRALGERAHTQLRALQVGQDADRTADLTLELAQDREALTMRRRVAMAEVQAKDIDTSGEQPVDRVLVGTGRAEGGDDLGVAVTAHAGALTRFRHTGPDMASSGSGLMRAPWPAQPKASKRALTTPRAAFFAACSALRGSNSLGCSANTWAHRRGHRQPDVGVDVDLAHAALDAALDLLDRHAVGLLDVAAVLADDRQPLLRHAGRAVHHQVRVRHRGVDLRDALDGQDVAGGLARELVGAVAGADGNRQRIDAGAGDEVLGLLGVGEHHVVRELACGAHAVLLAGLAGFERAQATELAFDRDADRVRHLADLARDLDVVVVARGRLRVFEQGAVHHYAGEARADRLLAHRRRGAVVLVQHDRDVGVHFHRRQHQMAQVGLAGVLARAGPRPAGSPVTAFPAPPP